MSVYGAGPEGLILTSETPFNFIGYFQFVNWKGSGTVSQSAEEYLIFHKFGHVSNHNFVNFVNVLCIFSVCFIIKTHCCSFGICIKSTRSLM